jgi:nitroreductase
MDNTIIEAIKARRSVRAYSDKAIPVEIIEQVLEAGRYAPSSLNTQPWKFAVITDKRLIADLSAAIKNFMRGLLALLPVLRIFVSELRDEKMAGVLKKTVHGEGDTVFYSAPLLILIVSEKNGRWVRVNCALAAENMMLAAHSLGLGSCFIGRTDVIKKSGFPIEKLGLDRGHSIEAALIMGYPKEPAAHVPERKRDNVISWK